MAYHLVSFPDRRSTVEPSRYALALTPGVVRSMRTPTDIAPSFTRLIECFPQHLIVTHLGHLFLVYSLASVIKSHHSFDSPQLTGRDQLSFDPPFLNTVPCRHAPKQSPVQLSNRGHIFINMSDVQTEVQTEVEPANIPLPASSMITVRLSDCGSGTDENALSSTASSPRNSNASLARSQSDCSSHQSTPSGSSDSVLSPVDWEILEKTEEQEPKDEGTDEVNSFTP